MVARLMSNRDDSHRLNEKDICRDAPTHDRNAVHAL